MAIKITNAVDLGPLGIELTADLDAGNPDPADDTRVFTRVFGFLNTSETPLQLRQRARGEFRALARLAAQERTPQRSAIPALIGDDIT